MAALPVGLCAQVACILEATARKPGNVHRAADFADTHFLDFLLSAAAIAPVLDRAIGRPVGQTVLDAVQATRQVTATNTNLGIVLLLAPLAAAGDVAAVGDVLRATTVDDARNVYAAIRLANPGGLGRAADQDVAAEPTVTLLDALRLAADRDGVARQYATDFADVFAATLVTDRPLEDAIVRLHLELLAARPDTLIVRKCGDAVAAEASARAAACLGGASLTEFDAWLRADGNRRNPGTTADLVTACLFVALRRGTLTLPLAAPFSPPALP